MPDHFYFRLLHPDIAIKSKQCRALHIMAGIMMFIYGLQFITDYAHSYMELFALMPPAIIIIFLGIFHKTIFTDIQSNRIFRILESGVLVMGGLHFFQRDLYFPAALYLFFAALLLYILFIEGRLFSPQYIDITQSGIKISLPTHTRLFTWAAISNITVKDDWLTIETQAGTFIQYMVNNSLTPEEFQQFLDFSKQKLAATR